MNKLRQTDPHSDLDLVIAWLGGRDEEKVEKATSILLGIGQPVVEYVIKAAIKPGKQPEHRIAILNVVQRIGGPLGPDEMIGLQALLRHRDPGVRLKAEQVIMAASPCGVSHRFR